MKCKELTIDGTVQFSIIKLDRQAPVYLRDSTSASFWTGFLNMEKRIV